MAKFKLIRTFHPVGQGAFYSEVIKTGKKEFTIVYDCGTTTPSINIDNIINKSQLPKTIDILFISHFHKDHISGIDALIQNHTVKNIFVPFLSKEDRILFAIIHHQSYVDWIKELIKKIINIFLVRSDHTEDIDKIENVVILTSKETTERCRKISNIWNYKLYYNGSSASSDKKTQLIMDFLKSKGIHTNKDLSIHIKSYPNFFLREELKNYLLGTYLPNHLKEDIKNTFSLTKDITQYKNIGETIVKKIIKSFHTYCLCVLSYEDDTQHKYISTKLCGKKERPACLYLGDSTVKLNTNGTNKCLDYYRNELDLVATMQVPHHGASSSHDVNFYIKFTNLNFAICSFGIKNPYGHPHLTTIQNIVVDLSKNFIPVTQLPQSQYQQIFTT